jgi:hypothetical protein
MLNKNRNNNKTFAEIHNLATKTPRLKEALIYLGET